ncbi:virulence factor secretion apparatus protein [Cupriavidus necator]|uniref:Virulence factor secretion apparatus protein n=1 Tax=Cupriavidus necator TaxID=106590 RepID=A0A1U9V268_CUPNE|nr:type VI secretion system tube protein Hcp [Cupriavidus necator]AQV98983.1 virulence factor secretion apparatus protein [Cupriavidus necator]
MDTIILDIPEIKGSNKQQTGRAAERIQIYSYSLGVSMMVTNDPGNSKRTSGKANFQSMSMTKPTDQATPGLYAACAAGRSLGDVKLEIGRTEDGAFRSEMTYTLCDAIVEVIQTSGASESQDAFSLNFTKIMAFYTQQKGDAQKEGTASFGWDVAGNVACGVSAPPEPQKKAA